MFPHPYYEGPGQGWWFLFWLVPLLYALSVGVVAYLLVQRYRRGSHGGTGPAGSGSLGGGRRGDTAETILAERFARGEIELQEYQARLAALRGAGHA